jgi:hypothetical protein
MTFRIGEIDRPAEWLRRLEEQPQRHRRLLVESGSLAAAAYQLAQARCRASVVATDIPTEREVGAAAFDVAYHAGWEGRMPTTRALADECDLLGLLVIRAMAA